MSELEDILNYLETTSLEPHDDYVSEFSYKDQKTLWKYIKELQQENQKYKEVIDKAISKLGRYADELTSNGNAYAVCIDLLDVLKEVE